MSTWLSRKYRIVPLSIFLCFLFSGILMPVFAIDLSILITVPGSTTPETGGGGGGGGGGGITTPTANVVLSGLAFPYAILTFLRNGAVVGTSVAGASGYFERSFLVDPGVATFGVWARDNFGLLSPTVSISFDVVRGSVIEVDSIALPPTIAHEHIGADGSLTFYGHAFPASVVRIFNNIHSFIEPFTVIAEPDGEWEYTALRGAFNPGNFAYKANYQYEPLGILSPFSNVLELQLETCSDSDFNQDGSINLTDLSILLYYWGRALPKASPTTSSCVDRNGDETVDLVDFSILMYEWSAKYQQES